VRAFAGLTITSNILMSLAVDNWGMVGMEVHAINIWRVLGGLLTVAGIILVAMF
jgi:transporter family-2 protein